MFRICVTDEELSQYRNHSGVNDNNGTSGVDGVSLSQFHAAFLFSPLFQLELWILSKLMRVSDPATTTDRDHLLRVANGSRASFGTWTATHFDGNRVEPVRSMLTRTSSLNRSTDDNNNNRSNNFASACQIMRCHVGSGNRKEPFCDTWWAVECTRNYDANTEGASWWADESTRQTSTNDATGKDETITTELVFGSHIIEKQDSKNNSTEEFIIQLLDPVHRLYSRLLLANAKATLVLNYDSLRKLE